MNFTIYFYLLQNYKLNASRLTQPLRLAHIQLPSHGLVPKSAAPRVPVKTVPDLSLPHQRITVAPASNPRHAVTHPMPLCGLSNLSRTCQVALCHRAEGGVISVK